MKNIQSRKSKASISLDRLLFSGKMQPAARRCLRGWLVIKAPEIMGLKVTDAYRNRDLTPI